MMPRWLVFSLLTLLFWGGWGAVSRKIGDSLNGEQSQALSTLGMIPPMIFLGLSRNLRSGRKPRTGAALGFLAGLLACAGNIAYYQTLADGAKAATMTPLTALYPLVTILLALLILKEKMHGVQFAGIALSLAAMYLFNVQSESALGTAGLLYAGSSIAFWGISSLFQKLATREASMELSTLGFFIAFIPVGAAIVLRQPAAWDLAGETWLWAFLLGLFSGLGNLTLMAAYSTDGKASIVTPLCGLYSVVTVPLAIVFLGETVRGREWLGISISLIAVVALAIEKRSPSAT